ncbi:MAG: hypothetical protein ACTSX9_05880 [Candidatus Njordarchaeales archaeon]
MTVIVIRAFDRVMKEINVEDTKINDAVDYVTYLIIELSQVLYEGNCICKLDGKYLGDEKSLKESLRRALVSNKDEIVVELVPAMIEKKPLAEELITTESLVRIETLRKRV